MSERTVSPSLERSCHCQRGTTEYDGSSSVPQILNGNGKRSWSPDRSASSTGTITGHNETTYVSADGSAGLLCTQDPKRTKKVHDAYEACKEKTFEVPEKRFQPIAYLPEEVWQYIFTFLSPQSLGRLMCVDKFFHDLISPSSLMPPIRSSVQSRLKPIEKQRLWTMSRQAIFPSMPRPLSSCSELDMWKLLRGRRCQICGIKSSEAPRSATMTPWNAGPSVDQPRLIWPFALRSCGRCLISQIQKETDLLLSPSSALMSTLQFAILSTSLNYVTSVTLQKESPPPDLQLTKWYFKPHVEEMKRELQEAVAQSPALAEARLRELEAKCQNEKGDIFRWENWELAGGFSSIAENDVSPQADPDLSVQDNRYESEFLKKQCAYEPTGSWNENLEVSSNGNINFPSSRTGCTLPPNLPAKIVDTASAADSMSNPAAIDPLAGRAISHLKTSSAMKGISNKKLQRRLDIEKRCAEMEHPIKPSTLAFMDSFNAAVQIAMPLTDQAWELLKPRLLAQRQTAERLESRDKNFDRFPQSVGKARTPEALSLLADDINGHDGEDPHLFVQRKLSEYAEVFIREVWQEGQSLTHETSPQFAADVLLHTRHRYYSSIVRRGANLRSVDTSLPIGDKSSGTAPHLLSLENMRWLYEHKVKPLTGLLRKDLFLCNACDITGRYFGFEPVVQHYAAKHTGSLSLGVAVVHWKSEWPETPPFDPNPTATKAALDMLAVPSQQSFHSQPLVNPSTFLHSPSHPSSTRFRSLQTNLPGSGKMPYPKPYERPYISPTNFGATDFLSNVSAVDSSRIHLHPQLSSRPRNTSSTQRPVPASGATRPLYGLCSQEDVDPDSANPAPHVASNLKSHLSVSSATNSTNVIEMAGQAKGTYQLQLEQLVKIAKETWDGTCGIPGLLDSIRAQIIIREIDLRFREQYTNGPNFAMFTECLNTSRDMLPIRSLSGLCCKLCVAANFAPLSSKTLSFRPERRLHTLSSLLAHFHAAHIEKAPPKYIASENEICMRPDWKCDMIDLPDPKVVKELMHAPGVTKEKLRLIVSTLHEYFTSPLPKAESADRTVEQEHLAEHGFCQRESTESLKKLGPSQLNTGQFVFNRPLAPAGTIGGNLASVQTNTQDNKRSNSSEEVQRDEYDPYDPACINDGMDLRATVCRKQSHDTLRSRNERFPNNFADVPRSDLSNHGTMSDEGVSRTRNQRLSLNAQQLIPAPCQSTDSYLRPIARNQIRDWQPCRAIQLGTARHNMNTGAHSPLSLGTLGAASNEFKTASLRDNDRTRVGDNAQDADPFQSDSIHFPADSSGQRIGSCGYGSSTTMATYQPSSDHNMFSNSDLYSQSNDDLSGQQHMSFPAVRDTFVRSTYSQRTDERQDDHGPLDLRATIDSTGRRPRSRFDRYEAQRRGFARSQPSSPVFETSRPSFPSTDYHYHRPVPESSSPRGPTNGYLRREPSFRHRELEERRMPYVAPAVGRDYCPEGIGRDYYRSVDHDVRVNAENALAPLDHLVPNSRSQDIWPQFDPTRFHHNDDAYSNLRRWQ